jgi:heptaprenyl diphosphate synthase
MENLNNRVTIKKITQIALFVSLSLILSYFDIIISRVAFPILPTTKIGFANIIVVYAIYQMDFKEALFIALS